MSDSSKIADFPESVKRNWDVWSRASLAETERKQVGETVLNIFTAVAFAQVPVLLFATMALCQENDGPWNSHIVFHHLWDTLGARILIWFFPLIGLIAAYRTVRRTRSCRLEAGRHRVQLADPRASRLHWLYQTRFAIEAAMFRNTYADIHVNQVTYGDRTFSRAEWIEWIDLEAAALDSSFAEYGELGEVLPPGEVPQIADVGDLGPAIDKLARARAERAERDAAAREVQRVSSVTNAS